MSETSVHVQLQQKQDYQFEIHFGDQVPVLMGDEPAPLGAGQGPSPVQLLAAAVGNCLSDSLLFALRKFKQSPEPLSCDVHAEIGRNTEGRVRNLHMKAMLTLGVPAASLEHLERVLSTFETYCTVTQSIGQGIPISLEVFNALGRTAQVAQQF